MGNQNVSRAVCLAACGVAPKRQRRTGEVYRVGRGHEEMGAGETLWNKYQESFGCRINAKCLHVYCIIFGCQDGADSGSDVQEVRRERHQRCRAGTSGRTSATTEARLAFNEAMSSLTRSTESENQILQQLLVAISGKQPGTSNDQPSPGDVPVPLRAALENAGPNYNSLVPYASTIHTALGISTLDEFKLITEEDIMQVPLPAMQKRALFSLARAQGLGSQAL
jgi:hypothetical protein